MKVEIIVKININTFNKFIADDFYFIHI